MKFSVQPLKRFIVDANHSTHGISTNTVPIAFLYRCFVDIFRYISGFRSNANCFWMNEKGKMLIFCTDGFRPAIFYLERLYDDEK